MRAARRRPRVVVARSLLVLAVPSRASPADARRRRRRARRGRDAFLDELRRRRRPRRAPRPGRRHGQRGPGVRDAARGRRRRRAALRRASGRWTRAHLQRPRRAARLAVGATGASSTASPRRRRPRRRPGAAAWPRGASTTAAYRAAGLRSARACSREATVDVSAGACCSRGRGRARPAVVNPSYFSPRAYRALGARGDGRWGSRGVLARSAPLTEQEPPAARLGARRGAAACRPPAPPGSDDGARLRLRRRARAAPPRGVLRARRPRARRPRRGRRCATDRGRAVAPARRLAAPPTASTRPRWPAPPARPPPPATRPPATACSTARRELEHEHPTYYGAAVARSPA